jgi:hypothetical protein
VRLWDAAFPFSEKLRESQPASHDTNVECVSNFMSRRFGAAFFRPDKVCHSTPRLYDLRRERVLRYWRSINNYTDLKSALVSGEKMHIGLIGGIGPAATEFYYRNLVRAHAAANCVLELTIVQADIRDLVQNMSDGARDKQAEIFLRLTRRLQAAGAEAVAVTSIAGHFCIRELEALSPLQVINAIPAIEAALVNRGLRRVGLLGTRVVMQSRIYGGVSAVDVVLPQGESFDATHNYNRLRESPRCRSVPQVDESLSGSGMTAESIARKSDKRSA